MSTSPGWADDSTALIRLLDPHAETLAPPLDENALHRLVARHIAMLLEKNREQLFSILYRIDVPEVRVKAAFATTAPLALPDVLASLMIDRHRQKTAFRAAYSAGRRPPD